MAQNYIYSHVEPRISLLHSSALIAWFKLRTIVDYMSSYTSALQTVALFGTHLNRLPALFGSLSFLAM